MQSVGINATTIGNGIIEHNLIDVQFDYAFLYRNCARLAHLENRTIGGDRLRQGEINPDQSIQPIDDFNTRVQDAITMALL